MIIDLTGMELAMPRCLTKRLRGGAMTMSRRCPKVLPQHFVDQDCTADYSGYQTRAHSLGYEVIVAIHS